MATLLFRTKLNQVGPADSFRNFIRSLTTMFVYLSTEENYNTLMYPAFNFNPW